MKRTVKALAVAVAVIVITSACSGSFSFSIGGQSPEAAAIDLIEGELSDELGAALTADCDELEDPNEGDSFTCTGTTDDGRVVDFDIDIGTDEVIADSVNLLVADRVPALEQSVLDALSAETNQEIPAGSLDCGDGPIIVPPDKSFVCRLSDWATDGVFDTTITITDQATWTFDIDVAEEPS